MLDVLKNIWQTIFYLIWSTFNRNTIGDGGIRSLIEKMEITLRKASALSKALLDAGRALPLAKTVKVSIYGALSVESEVALAASTLADNVTKATALIQASFELRKAIGQVNAASGIDDLLTQKASLDAVEKLLTGIGSSSSSRYSLGSDGEDVSDVRIAQAQLDVLKSRIAAATTPLSYGRSEDSVTVAVPAPMVQEGLADIRRLKTEIADQLLALNMTKKVTLSATTVALLEEFKLI
jgi:hypothetical protein